jgi:gliding motility-associated-like protein
MSDGSATVTVNGGVLPIIYQWNSSPAQTTSTASNLPAGIYNVTVSDANACSVSLNAVIVVVNYPVANVNTIMSHCDQPDGSATATASGGTGNYTYQWNTGSTTSSINNLLPGVYTVTVDDGHCDTIISVTIANQPGPAADFTYHPNPITIDNAQITFSSITESAISWEWNFGDGTGAYYGESVMHQYYAVGTYIVTLIVSDSYGCNDTIVQEVIVHDIFTIYIPNTFTPDGDGLNDVFQAYGISWEDGTYEMIIYNRWGNLVYQTTDPSKPWNGGFNNNPSPALFVPDVYVYYIKVKGINYREMVYMGKVTLLK